MVTFAYPAFLLLLLLIPAFVLLYVWSRWLRRRNLARFGKNRGMADLMPNLSPYKPPVKITIQMMALTCIILAVARPWGGVSSTNTTRQGIEVVVAVDASNSMLASATDSPEGIDRMRMAKLVMEKLIDRLSNDRVGLVVYAGDAYTLIPVTNDYTSAKMFLNSIDPSMVEHQGTNIAAAVSLASASFSKSKDIGKAVILITDAEELENPEEVTAVVKDAAKHGIQVDVMGVGTTKPMPIPAVNGEFVNPDTGQPVETALNENLALEIAKEGKGIYVNAANNDAVPELEKQLGKLNKKSLESSFLAVHDELFVIFVWLALFFIIADIFLLDRKIGWLDKFTFFKSTSRKKDSKK